MTHDHHHNEEAGLPKKHEPEPPPTRRQLFFHERYASAKAALQGERPEKCPQCRSTEIEAIHTENLKGLLKWFKYYFPCSLFICCAPLLFFAWPVLLVVSLIGALPMTNPHMVCHGCGHSWPLRNASSRK